MPAARRLGTVLAILGLLAILALTLYPNPRQARVAAETPLLCLVCGESGGADVALNLLLFMPFGAGLALLGWPRGRVVAICALLSLGVETFQFAAHTGRDASLSDLLSNTVSGAVAATLAGRLHVLLVPGRPLAPRLALAAAAAWLGVLVLTALSMHPWAPAGRIRNYCSAAYPTAETFAGTARTMILNGVALACDQDIPRGEIRRQLRRGEIRLETVAVTGDTALGRRIIHVLRTPRTVLVQLAQKGRAAAFHAPTRAEALRFFSPAVRLPQAFPTKPGGEVELVAGTEGRRMRLSATYEREGTAVELVLSPSFGWTLLFGIPMAPGVPLQVVAALWLGGLILPAAYWSGLAARPIRAIVALGGVVITGLALVPAVTGFDPVHWSEWLGAGAGIAVGWALSQIATYLQSRCGSPSTSAYSSS